MKHIFITVNIILLTITVFFCVKIIYKSIEGSLARPNVLPCDSNYEKIELSQKKIFPLSRYSKIEERNLFKTDIKGKAGRTKKPIIRTDLKKTSLGLELIGTVTGRKGQKGYAVIKNKGGSNKQSLYYEGDTVHSAVIKKISRYEVILHYNNEDYRLEVVRKKFDIPENVRHGSPADYARKIDRSDIKDISKLLKQIGVEEKPQGLYLSYIQKGSVFDRMGLRRNDLITEINGEKISSLNKALELYQNIDHLSVVKTQIKRNNKNMEITWNVD